ncbi:hypothetical protein EDB19DRAFT_1728686 [Suillus lakei]|nr:hypothetical protein EDB19DRAFT_1728686 [Suillus lakei]
MPSRPQLAPEGSGVDNGNRDDEVIRSIASREKQRMKRKEFGDNVHTEGVQPISVWCRGCHQAIRLDKRSRYYPGLWVKHQGKCPGILKRKKNSTREETGTPRRIQNSARPPPAHLRQRRRFGRGRNGPVQQQVSPR